MKVSKSIKNNILFWLLYVVITLTRVLPRFIAVALLGGLGTLCYYLISDARNTTSKNLRLALKDEYHTEKLQEIARNVFTNAGKNLADIFRLKNIKTFDDLTKIVDIEGEEYLHDAYARGKGVVCLTGHIGAFELLGAYISLRGYNVTVVGTELYDKRLDALLVTNRQHTGITNVHRGRDTLKLFRALKKSGVLGILIDQDTKVESAFVPFFGRPAATPIGAAVLALRTGAAVIPLAIQRQKNGRHLITVRPEITIKATGDRAVDTVAMTQKMTSELEWFIRQEPSQWVWMHRRWRRKPPTKAV